MGRSVLIVDGNETRRHAIRTAIASRGIATLEVVDAFTGLAALGRSDFGAVVLAEGRRALSLKGLVQLARKRHEGIRIFVILAAAANADRVRASLGDDVITISPDAGIESLATSVAHAFEFVDDAASNPWHGESTVSASSKGSVPRAARVGDSMPPSARPTISLEGSFEEGEGAALLMALLAQELTGRLSVDDGDQHATLYFVAGEPVWADEMRGDRAIHARLVKKSVVDVATPIERVSDGALLARLFEKGALPLTAVVETMRDVARDVVLDVAQRKTGSYRFVEEPRYRDWPPIVRLNPFGLVFESRRRTTPPERLIALSSELRARFVLPGPALRAAAPKLRPFLRDRDAGALVDGTTTVADLTREAGLDEMMGTLLVTTLVDGRLARLAERPLNDDERRVLMAAAVSPVDVRAPGSVLEPDASDDEKRNAIRSLGVRIRALSQPAQIVGVPLHADRATIDEAYRQRMLDLDPARVPTGAEASELLALLDEIKAKVKGAYETLTMQATTTIEASESNPGFEMDSNPF